MKRNIAFFLSVFLLALFAPAYATPENLSQEGTRLFIPREQVEALLPIKYRIEGIIQGAEGLTDKTNANKAVTQQLSLAKNILGRETNVKELLNLQPPPPPQLTPLQKAAGFVTFVNILWVFAICLLLMSLWYLIPRWFGWVVLIFQMIPAELYELLLYAASFGLVLYGAQLDPEIGQYLALTGCLFLMGSLTFTTYLHELKLSGTGFSGILFIAWALAAVICNSPLVGFLAIMALMSALGFSIIVTPMCYGIGFEEESFVGRATSAAFIVLGIFVVLRITGAQLPYIMVFEKGALFMGSFVGYLGLLIASSRWFMNRSPEGYIGFQLLTILAGVAALFVGSTWNIAELQKIGGTFFVLYLIEKTMEIPVDKKEHYAYILLFLSLLIYGLCMFIKTHFDLVRPYLFM